VTRFRPTRVEVDLDAVRHNVRALKPDRVELMAVVKADGYGHGGVAVARAALEAGATRLGVALVEEGLALREAAIDAPILVLSEFPPGSESEALAARLTPSLFTDEGLTRLTTAAAAESARGLAPVGVHVKVDTGMHRAGVWPPESAVPFLGRVAAAGLALEGLWTHLARSEEDEGTTKEQLSRFHDAIDAARAAGFEAQCLHAANSAATILHPQTHLDLVRPGIALYGIEPAPGVGADLGLRPALSWRSSVAAVRSLLAGEALSYGHTYRLDRDALIATVPVGYADGYARGLSGRAEVLIRGRRCRVAGAVTMDHLLVDCADLAVEPGDEVVLIGRQGEDAVTAAELARHAGTIAYEVVSRIGPRVPRELIG
jgi:alanine racemase